MAERGREVVLDEGDAALVSCAEEVVALQSPGLFLGLHIPHADLTALLPNTENRVMRRIPRDVPALRLLVDYIGLIHAHGELSRSELQRSVVSHVHDLLALALATDADTTMPAAHAGAGAARLRAVKHDIIENLARPDLSIDVVATRHHLQARYIQRLFQRDGTTFSQFVLERRLSKAHSLLLVARRHNVNIATVAFACGFNDQSYFNRRFRQHFGLTPSDVREIGWRGN
jgi:AraC-like DNA-binding protein